MSDDDAEDDAASESQGQDHEACEDLILSGTSIAVPSMQEPQTSHGNPKSSLFEGCVDSWLHASVAVPEVQASSVPKDAVLVRRSETVHDTSVSSCTSHTRPLWA